MEELRQPQKKTKVVIRPAPNLLKVILIAVILFSMAALIALRWVHNGIVDETNKLKEEAAAAEFANEELERKKEELDSVQSIQEIARDELGLVDPDTILIDPE